MAVYANITVDQGSDFVSSVIVEDSSGVAADLSGYTAQAQIRKTYNSVTAVDFDSVTIDNPSSGLVSIKLLSATTSSMKAGRYVYDVIVISSEGVITRVVEGQLEVTPSVTRL